jgi:hypothetical protein
MVSMFCEDWVSLKKPLKKCKQFSYFGSSLVEITLEKNAKDFHILQSWVSLKKPWKNPRQFSNLFHIGFFHKESLGIC